LSASAVQLEHKMSYDYETMGTIFNNVTTLILLRESDVS